MTEEQENYVRWHRQTADELRAAEFAARLAAGNPSSAPVETVERATENQARRERLEAAERYDNQASGFVAHAEDVATMTPEAWVDFKTNDVRYGRWVAQR